MAFNQKYIATRKHSNTQRPWPADWADRAGLYMLMSKYDKFVNVYFRGGLPV